MAETRCPSSRVRGFRTERQERADLMAQEEAEAAAEEAYDSYENEGYEEDYGDDDGRLIDGRY